MLYPDKSNFSGEGVYFGSQFKVQPNMMGNLRPWELEEASHVASTIRNQRMIILSPGNGDHGLVF